MTSPLRLLLACCLSAFLAGCATTPQGVVANADAERAMGRATTPIFLQANGGVYEDARLQRYLDGLVARLSAAAAIPAGFGPISIGILDTGTPMAYTVPGGSIYLSRGMVAMANDEAELAAVIAHEIGHVTARHIAERVAAAERLVLDVARKEKGTLSGSRNRRIAVITEKVQDRIGELTTFSKAQELEADRLSVSVLRETGYDPAGLGRVLDRIDRWELWRLESAGLDRSQVEEQRAQSIYPATDIRVAALGTSVDRPVDAQGQARLMTALDGIVAEDIYQGGFIREGRYRNAGQGLVFDVPADLLPIHGEQTRLISEDGQIGFQLVETGGATLDDAQALFAERNLPIERMRRSAINGFPALTGTIPASDVPQGLSARLVILDLGKAFLLVGLVAQDEKLAEMKPVLDTLVASIRMDDTQSPPVRSRYRTRRVEAGETVATIAQRSAMGKDAERRLRLLNGLGPGAEPRPGSWIKVIE